MPGETLSLEERVEIEVGVAGEESAAAIACRLSRPTSTVTRELKRNGGRARYGAVAADRRAVRRRCRAKLSRFEADRVLAAHVECRLAAKDSPMTIAVELDRGVHGITASVSHETIYRAVHAQGRAGLAKGLHVHLHRGRRCRKHRRPPGEHPAITGPLGVFNLIAERPAEAEGRGEVGHLEGDLIVGSWNRSAIVTLFDRASRYCWLGGLWDGHDAEATLGALIGIYNRIPGHLRLSLTWDQGREMAYHRDLTTAVGVPVFFAEPHSPWQRPTNENGNGLLRRYLPKHSDLSIHGPADLTRITDRINTMPRRSIGWATAHDIYTDAALR